MPFTVLMHGLYISNSIASWTLWSG